MRRFLYTLVLLSTLLLLTNCSKREDYYICRSTAKDGICEGRYFKLTGAKVFQVSDEKIRAYNPVLVSVVAQTDAGEVKISMTGYEGGKITGKATTEKMPATEGWVVAKDGVFLVTFESIKPEPAELFFSISYKIPDQ